MIAFTSQLMHIIACSIVNHKQFLESFGYEGNVVWKSSKFATEFEDIDINTFVNDLIYDLKDEIKNKKNSTDKSILKNIQRNGKTRLFKR